MEQISVVCLYMFKWRKFTESRFGTIGPSCRALLCSLLVGLEQLVAMTRSDEKATDFHLHGFVRLSCSIRRYLVIASIVAFVPDGLLVEALTDDRLVRRCDELEGILAEEVAWVQTISDSTWRRLALVAGLPEAHALLLRHDVVHSCHVASSYVHNKMFAVLRSYPWSLCVGNIATNLESLARDESNISDDFTYKVRALMHIGFSNVKLEQAILVLREASFSTISVEQGHGSCAVIHRFHPLYTGNQLASRAMLHQVRHLFTRTDAELKMEKRSCHIDALNRRQPGKTSARHAFLSFIMESAKSSLPAGAKMSSEARQEIMKQHAKLFEDLSVEEKVGFAHDAAMQAKRAKRGLQDEIDHHHDSMKLHIARLLQETSTTGLTCRSSSLRFNDDDFKHMHSMLESQRFGWAEVQRMRARALAPPRHPPLAVLEALRSCESHVVVAPKQEKPQWVKSLCSSRDILSGSILLASLEEGSQAYLFLYATQSPYAATFLSMKLRVEALPCLDDLSGDSLMTAVGAWNQHVFEYTDMAFVGDDKVGLEEADILVFFDASFASAGQMVANGLPLRFLEIVPLKLQPTEKTSKARAPLLRHCLLLWSTTLGCRSTCPRQHQVVVGLAALEPPPHMLPKVMTRAPLRRRLCPLTRKQCGQPWKRSENSWQMTAFRMVKNSPLVSEGGACFPLGDTLWLIVSLARPRGQPWFGAPPTRSTRWPASPSPSTASSSPHPWPWSGAGDSNIGTTCGECRTMRSTTSPLTIWRATRRAHS